MPESGTAVKAANIDNAFAANQNDLYANKPFYGAVFRIQNGLNSYLGYIEKNERLTLKKWLTQKEIKKGSFLLMVGNETNIAFTVDKNADSEQPNPFLSNLPAGHNHGRSGDNPIKEELEAQNKRLSGQLAESDRKNRDLLDELERAKRELSTDNSATLLAHQKEINDLKEEYRDRFDEKKDEIQDLKHEIRLIELERNQGDRSVGNRVLDIIQSNLSDGFLKEVAANIANLMQDQGNAGQPTQEQLQMAMQQAGQLPQFQTPPETPGNSQNNEGGPERVNIGAYNTGGQQNEEQPLQPAANEQTPPIATDNPKPPTPEQVKNELGSRILNAGLSVLMDKNANLKAYKAQVESQLALLRQQGITLDAAQWVQMAQMLANKAVEEQINADRVAHVIEPVLSGIPKQYRFMLKAINSKAAAEQLFSAFDLDASPAVKKVVVNVFDVLKNKK